METFSREVFFDQLNTKFSLIGTPEPLELLLVEVTEPTVTKSQTIFCLYFLGDGNFLLPQGTYSIIHEILGDLMLFLVPVSRENERFKYEAVFNLLNGNP